MPCRAIAGGMHMCEFGSGTKPAEVNGSIQGAERARNSAGTSDSSKYHRRSCGML